MLDKLFRAAVQRIVLPIGRALGHIGLTPNMLTMTGFTIVLAAAAILVTGSPFAAGWTLFGGAIFDVLDGAVAKATGKVTIQGAFLDSTLDRLSDGAILGSVAWTYGVSSDKTGLALALVVLVAGFSVSYVKAKAEALGFTCNVGIAERSERVGLIAIGLVFSVLKPALWILAILSIITVAQRFLHVWNQAEQSS